MGLLGIWEVYGNDVTRCVRAREQQNKQICFVNVEFNPLIDFLDRLGKLTNILL